MCVYDVYGPCTCPHGRCFTLLAQCFTIGSFVTSLMCITSCYFIYVRPIPEEGEAELPKEGFGYISRGAGDLEPPNYRQCVFYTSDEKDMYFDAMWRAGKAMSLFATIIGCGVMIVIMCTCCVAFQSATFDGLFWTCMLCFVAQALTFLAWGSTLCDDYECTWSSGTGMNLSAAMMWVWAANMIKSFPEALPPRGSRSRRSKQPLYQDDEEIEEDSPYDDYYDEYDEASEMIDFQDNGRGRRNDGLDDETDTYGDGTYHNSMDDGRYDEGYGDDYGTYYDEDGNYYDEDGYTYDNGDGTYYDEDGYTYGEDGTYGDYDSSYAPSSRNGFTPNESFQNKDYESEEFQPTAEDSRAFREPQRGNNPELSEEEKEFLGSGKYKPNETEYFSEYSDSSAGGRARQRRR